MKKLLFILLLCFAGYFAIGQTDTNANNTAIDTAVRVGPVIPKKAKKRIVKPRVVRVVRDSTAIADSLKRLDSLGTVGISMATGKPDSVVIIPKLVRPAAIKRPIDSFYLKILDNPFFRTKAKPVFLVINERERLSKDELFYLMAGILIFLAFIKLVFSRFFSNPFRLFVQPSFRQKQTREQLQQNTLPSLLLDLLFVFSFGAYISFLLTYYHFTNYSFRWLYLYTVASLTAIYSLKFIFLRFAGWVFGVKGAVDAYIFGVYLINKILAIVLIPFTLIIAFSEPRIINICITISILIIILLFIYRYLVSYAPIRREVKVSAFHFLLYVCAFEIIPLLLIYKTSLIYMNRSL